MNLSGAMTAEPQARPSRTRWRALGAGTIVTYLSVWALVFAIVTAPDRSRSDAGAP